MKFTLIILIFFVFIDGANSRPQQNGVLPNIVSIFCNNKTLQSAVLSAVPNISDPNSVSVDQIQKAIETALMPTFKTAGGTWLVSATSYHRVTGYVDDRANGMDTFCAVNAVNHNLYIVVMKIDN